MKFSSQLLTILVATTAYAVPAKNQLENKNNIDSIKSEIPTDNNFNTGDLSNINFNIEDLDNIKLDIFGKTEECDKAKAAYDDCIKATEMDDTTRDKNCEIFNSEKCQSFFKNDIKTIKGCENINEIQYTIMQKYEINLTKNLLNMECAKDESGKYCPLNNVSLKFNDTAESEKQQNTEDDFNKIYSEAVMNTCKSKSCINAALEFESGINEIKELFENLNTIMNFLGGLGDLGNMPLKIKRDFSLNGIVLNSPQDGFQLVNSTANYLRSEECSVQASSAITINYTIALIVTLTLFLFHLA